jgi:hypothetical protein
MKGQLQDFNPGELIQVFGLLGKSGSLNLERSDQKGLIVFRTGRIIYAASSAVRENLGSLLLARKLISEDELMEALERKDLETETKRLGNILVEMEVLSQKMLEEVIQEQFSRIISGFFHWNSGDFAFECQEFADHGEVEVDAEEFLVKSGVESTHVLLEAARQADENALEPESDPASIDFLIDEISSPTIGGEVVYKLLDIAGDICGRCVLFAVHSDTFQAVGHYGLDPGDSRLGKRISQLQVSRLEPSVLARALGKESPLLARLEAIDGDAKILDALGGPSTSKSVALPVKVDDVVAMVLYGDQLSEGLSTGWIELLEIAVLDAVRERVARPGAPASVS